MPLLDAIARRGSALTTPFLPDDYLSLVNPLWATRELRARVEAVQPEADGAATLTLVPGRGWTGHQPGQYVGVGVEVDGVLHWRSYSLTSPKRLTITVKAQGLVSQRLVHHTPAGSVLRLRPAVGDFLWDGTRPALFLTGGSGITPVMGMLRDLATRGLLPDITHVHSARTSADVIFAAELRGLASRNERYALLEQHTDSDGLLTMAKLEELVPDWRTRQTWVCGPAGLVAAVEAHWSRAGLSPQLHVERFTPVLGAGGTGGTVTFARSGTSTDSTKTLLETGEEQGVLMPSGCRMGICFGCVLPLLEGQVRDVRTGEIAGGPGDLVQTCINTAAGDCSLDI